MRRERERGESVVCATERERRNQTEREQRLGKLQLLEKRRKREIKSHRRRRLWLPENIGVTRSHRRRRFHS